LVAKVTQCKLACRQLLPQRGKARTQAVELSFGCGRFAEDGRVPDGELPYLV
jgi:hypothetical protein